MRYFVNGIIGLVIGAIIGAVLGPVSDFLIQALMYHASVDRWFTAGNFFRLRTTLFALGGAAVVGLFGLIIALAIAFLRRPKVNRLVQA